MSHILEIPCNLVTHLDTNMRNDGDVLWSRALTARCEGTIGLTVSKRLESAPGGV